MSLHCYVIYGHLHAANFITVSTSLATKIMPDVPGLDPEGCLRGGGGGGTSSRRLEPSGVSREWGESMRGGGFFFQKNLCLCL